MGVFMSHYSDAEYTEFCCFSYQNYLPFPSVYIVFLTVGEVLFVNLQGYEDLSFSTGLY